MKRGSARRGEDAERAADRAVGSAARLGYKKRPTGTFCIQWARAGGLLGLDAMAPPPQSRFQRLAAIREQLKLLADYL